MRLSRVVSALVLSLLLLPPHIAQGQTGIALRVGSPGLGLEVARDVHPQLAVRGGIGTIPGQSFDFTLDDNRVDVGVDVDVDLGTFYGLADFSPLGPHLRLTTGVIYTSLKLKAVGLPLASYQVGNRSFTPEELGSMTATADYGRKIVPYLGVGLGSLTNGRRMGIVLDAGVALSGSLSVEVDATGMLSPSVDQQVVIQEALDGVRVFPAVSLGLALRL